MFGNPNIGENLTKALAAWGDPLPEWVRMLALACDKTNQREAGERIGQSSGTVSKVLRQVYPGDYAEIERKVRAAYSADTVLCPVSGAEIALRTCLRHRRRKGPLTDWRTRKFADTCPNCPHNTDLED